MSFLGWVWGSSEDVCGGLGHGELIWSPERFGFGGRSCKVSRWVAAPSALVVEIAHFTDATVDVLVFSG